MELLENEIVKGPDSTGVIILLVVLLVCFWYLYTLGGV